MKRGVALGVLVALMVGCATDAPRDEKSKTLLELSRKKAFVSGNNAGRYQPYVTACLNRILDRGNLTYPEEARGRLYGSVQVTFEVQRSGALQAVQVEKSSGHAVLDAALVKAIRSAAPFDPLPPGLDDKLEILSITQTFDFAPK